MQNVFVKHLSSCHPGFLVRIAGEVPEDADWFAINLQTGTSIHPRPDIALHLSPRFEGKQFRVVRNALINQQWGPEENAGGFPFKLGEEFEIIILLEADKFKIAVNGQHFTEFYHRLPYQAIDTILIDGDVVLYLVDDQSTGRVQPSAPVENENAVDGFAAPVPGASTYPTFSPPPPPPYPAVGFSKTPQFYQTMGGNPPYPTTGPYGQPVPQARWAYGSQANDSAPRYPPYPTDGYGPVEGGQEPASSQMPIPEHSPRGRRKSSLLKAVGIGAAAGVGAFAISQLAYPAISSLGEELFDDKELHQCEEHTTWGSSDSDSSE